MELMKTILEWFKLWETAQSLADKIARLTGLPQGAALLLVLPSTICVALVLWVLRTYSKPSIGYFQYGEDPQNPKCRRVEIKSFESIDLDELFSVEVVSTGGQMKSIRVFSGPWLANEPDIRPIEGPRDGPYTINFRGFPSEGTVPIQIHVENPKTKIELKLAAKSKLQPRDFRLIPAWQPQTWLATYWLRWFAGVLIFLGVYGVVGRLCFADSTSFIALVRPLTLLISPWGNGASDMQTQLIVYACLLLCLCALSIWIFWLSIAFRGKEIIRGHMGWKNSGYSYPP